PEIQSRLHVGINEVTRYMESYIASTPTTQPVMYICKREIKPLQLCQHLLSMAALAKIKLIPMPADSESKLGQALGITRASVVLIEIMEDKEESLRLSAQEVPLIEAPWLSNALEQKVHFIGENVKILKTVAPI
ncbi:uncharacterized protein EV154DRAFT_398104, partial [Mucor mucedo]|uniref:uncharacterized protein n=1 Tax=Mucor mucedo TaxID=29922 RepID=UPI00221E4608